MDELEWRGSAEMSERDIGRHEAEIEQLQRDMTEIKADVKAIIATMEQAKGGWRAIALVAGMAGLLGALTTKFIYYLIGLPIPK